MNVVRLGVAGLGTVAQGLLSIIAKSGPRIAERSGVQLEVARVASRSAKPEVDLLGAEFTTDLNRLLEDDIDVVVELIGGEEHAHTLIETALRHGKPVVTANKAVIANSGNSLMQANEQITLRYEAAVAGAIPIILAVQNALIANDFEHLVGILNGTCNYILTSMEESGVSFEAALATAQELGYAEADPTFDVEGIDAAHKLTILGGLAFDMTFDFSKVFVEGISKITAADIEYAEELGYKIKHICVAKRSALGVEMRAHPALLPRQALLANVNDVANAVVVQGDASGQTLFSGPGAGGLATASAVLADIVNVAVGTPSRGSAAESADVFVDIAQVECANYLRIPVRDEAGVFAEVAGTLSSHEISIEAAIQKEPEADAAIVDIVIVTGECRESAMQAAVEELMDLSALVGEMTRIRVENLD